MTTSSGPGFADFRNAKTAFTSFGVMTLEVSFPKKAGKNSSPSARSVIAETVAEP
jgi:hypothetical protein